MSCYKRQNLILFQAYGAFAKQFYFGHAHKNLNTFLTEKDHKEGRALKTWYLQTVVLEKTPESPLDNKEIKPVNLKGSQSWTLIGMTDAEADANSWLIGKDPDAGKDWGQKEKKASEDEMAGWHFQGNGHERGQTSGDGEGQRGLVVHGVAKSRTRLDDWTATNSKKCARSLSLTTILKNKRK